MHTVKQKTQKKHTSFCAEFNADRQVGPPVSKQRSKEYELSKKREVC